MMRKVLILTCIACLSGVAIGQAPRVTLPKQIYLATTDWCPYACEDQADQKSGIVHEYLTQLFAAQGIILNIQFFPWSRAIEEANKGRVDGLLTAVYAEAPDLVFTHTPTMAYGVCFFTEEYTSWQYKGLASLQQINLAVIQDYGYGQPVDGYIKEASAGKLTVIASGGINRLSRMLIAGRVDAFVGDSNVVAWLLKTKRNLPRQVGCLPENPFYIAFNSNRPWVKEIVNKLDIWLNTARNQLKLKGIKQEYLGL